MLLFMICGLLVLYSSCPQWTSILDAVTKTHPVSRRDRMRWAEMI